MSTESNTQVIRYFPFQPILGSLQEKSADDLDFSNEKLCKSWDC